jgi:hypothetical protein
MKIDHPVVAVFAVELVIAVLGALTAVAAGWRPGQGFANWALPTLFAPKSRLAGVDYSRVKGIRYRNGQK